MLYKFPPPAWFEPGTTSHVVSEIVAWIVVIGLPGSIIACWAYRPRPHVVWVFAIVFWSACFCLLSSVLLRVVPPRAVESLPVSLVLVAFPMLVALPFPAIAAARSELIASDPKSPGFRDLRTWGCLAPIGLIVAGWLMLPGLSTPAEHMHRSVCKNHLKMIGLAMHKYNDVFNTFPSLQFQTDEKPVRSWRVELLPYLESQSEFETYDKQSEWDSPQNLQLAKKFPRYTCPSVPRAATRDALGRRYTAYAGLIGRDSPFPKGSGRAIKQITDGLSNTALIAEACGQQIVWTEPRDIDVTEQNTGVNLPGTRQGHSPATWSSYHQSGAQILMADGAVRFLSATTDPKVLRALITANGGEVITDEF